MKATNWKCEDRCTSSGQNNKIIKDLAYISTWERGQTWANRL